MSFFDTLSSPQISQGLLGLAAGLLTPGDYGAFGPALGRGFSGMSQNMQAAQQQSVLADYRKMQQVALEQQVAQNKQKEALIGNLLGIPTQTPTSLVTPPQTPTSGLLAPAQTFPVSDVPAAPAGAPAASAQPAAQPTGSPLDHLPPEMKQRVVFDLLFNGGKGIPDILKPNVKFENGVAVDMNTVKPGFSVPTVNANGMAVQLKQNPDGTWTATAPDGAVRTYRSFQDAQQDAQASHDLVQVVDSNGNTRLVPKSTAIKQANGTIGGGAAITSRNPADVQYDTDIAKQTAAQYNQIQQAGLAAPSKISQYQQLADLLDNTSLSPAGFEIAQAAQKLGILPESQTKSLGNAQAATAIGNRLALTLRNTAEGGGMPGSMSDSDRRFLTDQIPQLITTAQGRRQMIGMQVAIERRNQQVAQMARDWRRGGGRLDKPDVNGRTFFDYLQMWSDKNPLFARPQK